MTAPPDDALKALPAALREKLDRCRDILRRLEGVVVAFSGGVDSTFLLALAVQTLGRQRVLAVTGVSPSVPQRELREARELARQLDAQWLEIPTGELDDPNYSANPADRCYYCKMDLFTRLAELARRRGLAAVVSGANADDKADFRPGLRAGAELGVVNPLMEAGLTKADVRAASRALGLPTWNKPAYACLASRIPYGQPITAERLGRIERAEAVLHELGLRCCRVRDHHPVARLEVPEEAIERAVALRRQIVGPLKALGFAYVTIDLEGFRSGSMNETLQHLGGDAGDAPDSD